MNCVECDEPRDFFFHTPVNDCGFNGKDCTSPEDHHEYVTPAPHAECTNIVLDAIERMVGDPWSLKRGEWDWIIDQLRKAGK